MFIAYSERIFLVYSSNTGIRAVSMSSFVATVFSISKTSLNRRSMLFFYFSPWNKIRLNCTRRKLNWLLLNDFSLPELVSSSSMQSKKRSKRTENETLEDKICLSKHNMKNSLKRIKFGSTLLN